MYVRWLYNVLGWQHILRPFNLLSLLGSVTHFYIVPRDWHYATVVMCKARQRVGYGHCNVS